MVRLRMLTVLLLSMASLLGSTALVLAQDPPGARGESAAPESGGDEDEAADADSREVSDGDSKVKVFRFSGLDISGRLKSPQLLYFLNRLRAEFDRPKLPHRSFVPEMERSTKNQAL